MNHETFKMVVDIGICPENNCYGDVELKEEKRKSGFKRSWHCTRCHREYKA